MKLPRLNTNRLACVMAGVVLFAAIFGAYAMAQVDMPSQRAFDASADSMADLTRDPGNTTESDADGIVIGSSETQGSAVTQPTQVAETKPVATPQPAQTAPAVKTPTIAPQPVQTVTGLVKDVAGGHIPFTNIDVIPGDPLSYVGTVGQCPFYEMVYEKGCNPPADILCNADWTVCTPKL